MQVENNKITLSDDQASAYFGEDWIQQIENTGGSIFFDGTEVYPEICKNGPFHILTLTAVHNNDLEELYNI